MSDDRGSAREVSPWAVGFTVFASTLMIVLGVFHAIQGLVALLDDESSTSSCPPTRSSST